MLKMLKLKDRCWFYLLVVVLIVSAVIKMLYCLKVPGPIVYGDELLYRKRSAELFYTHSYYSNSYPLGYPLVISLSYFFTNFYRAIQVINIGLALLGNIAVWKILRMFINEKYSFYGVLLVSLVPWQYTYCSRVQSENLYYPILMWTLYLFLWIFNQPKMKYKYCVGLGVMIASLHLTRHVTIVLLPVFTLCWFLDLKESGKWQFVLTKGRLIKGICVIIGYTAIYGSWVTWRLCKNKGSLDQILGLNISNGFGAEKIKEYATMESLFIFIILYLSYVVLLLLYEFPIGIKGFIKCVKGDVPCVIAKAGCLFGGIGLMLVVAATRHSWRSKYNYPDIQYVIGRYILYVLPIFIIWSHVISQYIEIKKERKSLLILQIINTILFVVAGLILCRGKIIGLRDSFLNNVNTEDVWYIYYGFWFIIGGFILIGMILLFKAQRYIWVFNAVMLITLIYGARFSFNRYSEKGIFGKTFSQLNENVNMQNYKYIINDTPTHSLVNDIEFWTGVSENPIFAVLGAIEEIVSIEDRTKLNDYYKEYQYMEVYDISSSEDSFYEKTSNEGLVFCAISKEFSSRPLITCVYDDIEYGIYECPIETSVQITETYPKVITCGEGFNIQPNGQSALAIQTNLSFGKYALYLNGEYYTNISINQDGVGSVFIEDEIFQKPGEFIVEVHFDKPYIIENVGMCSIEIIENH